MVLVAACASGLSAPLALPAAAQEAEADGRSLMERGAQMFWNGLRREMEPATDYFSDLAAQFGPSMRSFWEEMGPALSGIVAEVEDWSVYHPPEKLPNGDIILRRKTPLDPAPEAPEGAEQDQAPAGSTDI